VVGGVKAQGMVTLVGAGPGDPDLLTLKALKAIQAADVIVYDRLVSPEILALARPGTARIDVGKQPARHPVPQNEINDMLVRLVRSGRNVVRLKGGDPFIFGRGSEEALELARNDIAFSVIPGITAAQGAAASLTMPLTHRGLASSVRYVTGHCRDNSELDLDWDGLADPQTTLVIYMGLANLREIVTRLMAAGRSTETPVLAVNNATLPRERRLRSSLGCIAKDMERTAFEGPVLFVIGDVVKLHDILAEGGGSENEAPLVAFSH
jgi:uroporphyrin-III C-methyltransferase